jgi:hypothetical protein
MARSPVARPLQGALMKAHVLGVALLLVGATALVADEKAEHRHKPSGLKFTLPKGWKCAEDGGKLVIQNPDKSITVVGGVIEKKEAKAVFDNVDKFLATLKILSDIKVTDGPKKEKVNGLEQSWYEGTAKVKTDDGKTKNIEWDLTVVSGGKGLLFLIGLGKLDKNEKVYEKFFESIKEDKDE